MNLADKLELARLQKEIAMLRERIAVLEAKNTSVELDKYKKFIQTPDTAPIPEWRYYPPQWVPNQPWRPTDVWC